MDTIIGASDKTFYLKKYPSKTKVLGKQKINILMKYFAVIPAAVGPKQLKTKIELKLMGSP